MFPMFFVREILCCYNKVKYDYLIMINCRMKYDSDSKKRGKTVTINISNNIIET